VKIGPVVEAVWSTLESFGLALVRGTMSTIVEGTSQDVFAALRKAFDVVADEGATVMVLTISNACPRQAPPKE
jgi:uncharacterized protein YqgV (UPF0045/DUF77 family)